MHTELGYSTVVSIHPNVISEVDSCVSLAFECHYQNERKQLQFFYHFLI